jgi:hypothetical protein
MACGISMPTTGSIQAQPDHPGLLSRDVQHPDNLLVDQEVICIDDDIFERELFEQLTLKAVVQQPVWRYGCIGDPECAIRGNRKGFRSPALPVGACIPFPARPGFRVWDVKMTISQVAAPLVIGSEFESRQRGWRWEWRVAVGVRQSRGCSVSTGVGSRAQPLSNIQAAKKVRILILFILCLPQLFHPS